MKRSSLYADFEPSHSAPVRVGFSFDVLDDNGRTFTFSYRFRSKSQADHDRETSSVLDLLQRLGIGLK